MATVKGEARQLILDAAEELIARQGVEGVSLRAINAAAGVSPGVLHYHFGSREVLVTELISRHMEQLVEQRGRMLDVLQPQQHPDIRDIVATLVTPLAELARGEAADGRRYVRFIARLYADRSPILDEVSRRYQEVHQAYPALLARALPHQTAADLELRLAMANHCMLQMLADLTAPVRPWLNQGIERSDAEIIEMLIDFMCSGIRG